MDPDLDLDGSMPLTNGSGFGPDPDADPAIFVIDLPKMPTKNLLKTSFFKGKKSKRSHKTLEIKLLLTIFAK